MQWPLNWEPVVPEARQALEVELRHETKPGHPLYSVPVEAVARRGDCDDVLFLLNNLSTAAVVHLSYSTEEDPLWPRIQVYSSLSEWAEQATGGENA